MRYYIYNHMCENTLQSVLELACKLFFFHVEKTRLMHKSCSFCIWHLAHDNNESVGDLLVNDSCAND